jgi:hypothetical protein
MEAPRDAKALECDGLRPTQVQRSVDDAETTICFHALHAVQAIEYPADQAERIPHGWLRWHRDCNARAVERARG